MSNEVSTKELGEAGGLTMDDFVRTVIGQMFENDNDTALLEVTLDAAGVYEPPKIEIELRLKSINGVPTRNEDNN